MDVAGEVEVQVPSAAFEAVHGSLVLAESYKQADRIRRNIRNVLRELGEDIGAEHVRARNHIETLCIYIQDMATGYANLENVNAPSFWADAQEEARLGTELFMKKT